jgi:predicted nucleic-acid-binding protein
MTTIGIDTNILVRFLQNDHSELSLQSLDILSKAESGEYQIYLDSVIVAEVVWVMSSVYHQHREIIAEKLTRIISSVWIVSPHKQQLLKALDLFKSTKFSFVDCWLATVCKAKKIKLSTFDSKLNKLTGNF